MFLLPNGIAGRQWVKVVPGLNEIGKKNMQNPVTIQEQ